ncbi:hypothetical protein [Marinobacterium iners]|uniref:Protein argonaute n=1 Tax=Marinobacterium iners DSM 11526 TaxID=1122198 RepID=A0A1H3ZFW5_9GAMM|nr:hypothetical protein [Marinobacterium iners]SEA22656.1 hypothetical protein SAMN02745729_10228 [Marinobacterium iners DSM 11526]
MAIKATVYRWRNWGDDPRPKVLWERFKNQLLTVHQHDYQVVEGPLRALAVCAGKQVHNGWCHFPTIKAHFMRHDRKVYVEMSLRGCFCLDNQTVKSIASSDLPDNLQGWVRSVSGNSIADHVEAVRDFVTRCNLAGLELEEANLKSGIARPVFATGAGDITTDELSALTALGSPWRAAVPKALVVHTCDPDRAHRFLGNLRDTQRQIFGSSLFIDGISVAGFQKESFQNDCLHILLVPGLSDFVKDVSWQRLLYRLERSRVIFKVVRASNALDRFVVRNLLFDLYVKAGGIPWIAKFNDQRLVCALDAGHSADLGLSRWVGCRYSKKDQRQRIYFQDCGLAEQVPEAIAAKLLVKLTSENSLVLRDGRMHKSDTQFSSRAGLDVIAINKRPTAVIYEEDNGRVAVASTGAYLEYPDGAVLLQSAVGSSSKDYIRPIHLSSRTVSLSSEVISDLQALVELPSLSSMHPIRLPLPVYWADLASKLNSSDWVRVLGNGWKLEGLVPALRES